MGALMEQPKMPELKMPPPPPPPAPMDTPDLADAELEVGGDSKPKQEKSSG